MAEVSKEIVRKSIALISELTKHYGPDEGHAAWEGLCDALDDDGELKMAIFQVMLTGNIPLESIVIKSWNRNVSDKKVTAIKWVRGITNLGLKEAKELIEDVELTANSSHYKGAGPDYQMFEICRKHFIVDHTGAATIPNYDQWSLQAKDLGLDVDFI